MSDGGSAFIQVAAGFHPAARGWAGELTLAGAQERYVAPICPRNSNSRSGRDLAGAGLEVTGPKAEQNYGGVSTKNEIPLSFIHEKYHVDFEAGVILNKRLGTVAGSKNSRGYIRLQIGGSTGKTFAAHRVIWAMYHGYWPEYEIDHINRIRDDNRICNLRIVSPQENAKNKLMYASNKSGHTGVYKVRNFWRATITANGVRADLGVFYTFEAAVAARQDAERKLNIHNNQRCGNPYRYSHLPKSARPIVDGSSHTARHYARAQFCPRILTS